MKLVRWDPFRDDTLFANWEPPVDIQETEKEFILKADLPDVKKEDVKVEFEDGVLCVEGERKQEEEEQGKRFHKIERSYGKFVRRFALPTDIDGVHAKAEFRDGVLNVHLPKTATAKATSIEVKIA